ncbi:hypothetical protein [Moorena sp. SIO4G3]|uniref:hypothetical protein n=1 Tax=Moorena sp. SIO4G3 TaxID=2607821 RepID=UPI00142CDD4A|nr:hypothetical protein [Moorena sp. SIO4G3]NEO76980.1 hypothetical protein [Moorena sp. SIO4G3]
MKRKTLFLLTWVSTIVLILCWVLPTNAFNEFYRNGLKGHSTFHYEFTRTLVRAAGFSPELAEQIAVTNQAVDSINFTGYNGTNVRLTNTGRFGPYSLYWHFPRRGCTDSFGVSYPTDASECNTCNYFTDSSDSCPRGIPELNTMDQWAIYGNSDDLLVTPKYSLNRRRFKTVPASSITALGIFLHSLADSYSHERCMETMQLREHKPFPAECNVLLWHLDLEFGGGDPGVPYTKNAARAVFKAAVHYIAQNGEGGDPLWSFDEANNFIEQFAEIESPDERAQFAIDTYNNLS